MSIDVSTCIFYGWKINDFDKFNKSLTEEELQELYENSNLIDIDGWNNSDTLFGEVICWSGDLYENFYLDLNSNSFNEQLAKAKQRLEDTLSIYRDKIELPNNIPHLIITRIFS